LTAIKLWDEILEFWDTLRLRESFTWRAEKSPIDSWFSQQTEPLF
jgi:hypothetical protein